LNNISQYDCFQIKSLEPNVVLSKALKSVAVEVLLRSVSRRQMCVPSPPTDRSCFHQHTLVLSLYQTSAHLATLYIFIFFPSLPLLRQLVKPAIYPCHRKKTGIFLEISEPNEETWCNACL